MYRTLDSDKIIATLEVLERRLSERFPGAGLAKVGRELTEIARISTARTRAVARPNLALRAGIGVVLVVGLGLLFYVGSIIEVKRDAENLYGVLQGIDAAMNIIVLMGAAVFFLATLEHRWGRQRALAGLHELRSNIHVIDMHQLTKDPSVAHLTFGPRLRQVSSPNVRCKSYTRLIELLVFLLVPTFAPNCTPGGGKCRNRNTSIMLAGGSTTAASPRREMSAFELTRYLDYCSEMLSLAAKVAALYAAVHERPGRDRGSK